MAQNEPGNPIHAAERVFSDFQRRAEKEPDLDFDAFCDEHSEIRDELRFLQSIYIVGQSAARSASFRQVVKERFGDDASLELSVTREATPVGSVPQIVSAGPEGRYEIQEKLAEGGMGVIFRVRDRNLKRTLAMKVMKGGATLPGQALGAQESSQGYRRFLEEAHVTAQLDHPGIVPVHELGRRDSGEVFFTMSLVQGQSLKEIFELARKESGSWNLSRVVGVMIRVGQAVAFAHSKGVIHRDLKPDNVMVGRFGEVYVLDWGLARKLTAQAGDPDPREVDRAGVPHDDSEVVDGESEATRIGSDSDLATLDGTVLGTLFYMSPEQARGRLAELDATSDVYSLGAMLYEFLAGTRPYASSGERISAQELLERILAGPPAAVTELRPQAPRELVAICEKAMARERADRFPNSFEFTEDLQAYLDHRVVKAYETGWLAELKKWSYRHRTLLKTTAAVAALLVVGAFVVVRVSRIRQAEEFMASAQTHMTRAAELKSGATELEERWKALKREELEKWLPGWHRQVEFDTYKRWQQARQQRDSHQNDAILDLTRAREIAPPSVVADLARDNLKEVYVDRFQAIALGEELGESPDYYRMLVEELELPVDDLSPRGEVSLTTAPSGADVYCFRYEEGDEMQLLPLPFDPRSEQVVGAPYLQIERIGDSSKHQGVFAVGDRILALGGEIVRSRTGLASALLKLDVNTAIPIRLSRAGRESTVSWTPFPATDGTVAAGSSVKPERIQSFQEQFGFEFAGYPLDFVAACHAGRTGEGEGGGVELDLPQGSYLFVLRREGYRDTRVPVRIPSSGKLDSVRLRKDEDIPPGCVYIPAGRFHYGGDRFAFQSLDAGEADVPSFFMRRYEVTFREYLEFLNDPDVFARTSDTGMAEARSPEARAFLRARRTKEIRLPIVPAVPGELLLGRLDDHWELTPGKNLFLDSPVTAISQLAALEFAQWLTERSPRWRYRLATDIEWEKAARGVDERIHVWGNYLVWTHTHCHFTYPTRAAPPRAVGLFPLDATVYGVRDMAGSMSEPTTSPLEQNRREVTRRGSSWWASDTQNLRIANRNSRMPDAPGTDVGIRLVVEARASP